jgi:hypothetical protein
MTSPTTLYLYPGHCSPSNLALLKAAALLLLDNSSSEKEIKITTIDLNNMLVLTSNRYFPPLRNRIAPLLLAKDKQTVIFGAEPIAQVSFDIQYMLKLSNTLTNTPLFCNKKIVFIISIQ